MTKQRNSPQKKKHEEMTAPDFTNRDTSKMSEPEFRITIIRILAGVKNRLQSLSAEIKEVKNSQNEIKKCYNSCNHGWMQWQQGRMRQNRESVIQRTNLQRIRKQKKAGD